MSIYALNPDLATITHIIPTPPDAKVCPEIFPLTLPVGLTFDKALDVVAHDIAPQLLAIRGTLEHSTQ